MHTSTTFDPQDTVRRIQQQLSSYLQQSGLQALVIGQSGGIDSAIVSALAAPVCRSMGIPLISSYIHIETNKADEEQRATAIGQAFGTSHSNVDLTPLYYSTKQVLSQGDTVPTNPSDRAYRIRMGNVKARLRMIYLYNLAQAHRGMVLSTENYTEYLLGFWTLHGDVGDYGPIASLWKMEVYACARWMADNDLVYLEHKAALKKCIDATPTDGLGITSSDLEQLQSANYQEVDHLLKRYLAGERTPQLLEHPVILRHLGSAFKRNNPTNVPREQITDTDLVSL